MRIGIDYYPEQWDRSLWEADADLMQKTGVKLVRMGEFAWSSMEPREGEFTFEWLDEVIDLMTSRGMEIVLCTPTHNPPLWLFDKHPDAMSVDRDGSHIRLGTRGRRCLNHEAIRFYSGRIVEKMTQHYAHNKSVVAWQVDNETSAQACCCEVCSEKFRQWLKNKYGTLDALNRAYKPAWSLDYTSWEQITPPLGNHPDCQYNPAYMLDYQRFTSDNAIDFVLWQADIIRRNCPGVPVTHNMWFCPRLPNWYKEYETLDFMSYDNYPVTKLPKDPETCYTHAFHLDLARGVKRAPFWVMEQLGGFSGGWGPMDRAPEPGMIRGYALQAFAHGADTVVFFRWRTCISGCEMFWHGLIDHSNVPGRRFAEFADVCKMADSLQYVQGAENKADAAILFSFDNEYAFKLQPMEGYYYFEQIQRLHGALTALGLNVDIIGEHESLDGYRIVCAPEMFVTDMDVVRRLHDFAAQGGTVVMTTRSGVKDQYNNAIMAQLPTVYRDMVGAHAEEYSAIGGDSVQVKFADGTVVKGRQWCDILQTDGAEVLAVYDSEYFRGTPAITRNVYGEGAVYYIATVGEQALYNKLIRSVVTEAGLSFIPDLPPHVEVTTRTGNGRSTRFIFNNTNVTQVVRIDGKTLTLPPFDMHIDCVVS